jgi:general L-amino acid transport system permease protein
MASSALPPSWVRVFANRRAQATLAQLLAALLLALVAVLLITTLIGNLARLNLSAGFGFLLRPAGMRMGETVIPFEPTDSFAWAMMAAAVNTIRVALAGIVIATILGTAIGIMRLSSNPLLRGLTSVYVEVFRNTPLLLQILFWSAILLKLPGVRQAISLGDWAFLSQRGLQIPALVLHGDPTVWSAVVAAACCGMAVGFLLRRNGRAASLAAGFAAGLLVLPGVLLWQGALGIEYPIRKLFGFSGGLTLTPEFCALLAGLVAYTGAFIAEIVRGGILAVPAGQWEAARSLGLRDAVTLRRIVLPQAMRVILPAMTSQYVGVIKNSSLAVAIGYPDLFWAVSTAINVTGHAIEGVAVMMVGYLALCFATSGAMNVWYARMLRRGAR